MQTNMKDIKSKRKKENKQKVQSRGNCNTSIKSVFSSLLQSKECIIQRRKSAKATACKL